MRNYFYRGVMHLRLVCLLPLFGALSLQSCLYHSDLKATRSIQAKKRDEASSYNVQLGMGYLKQGDSPRAKRKFLGALALAPDSAEANGAIAWYFEKTGDLAKAAKYYQKALHLAPGSGSQLNNYGAFLCRTGKYRESETYFIKAVDDEHYINTAGAWENAGLCVAAIPDYSKAELYLTRALEQDARRKQSLYELTSIQVKQNQERKALSFLHKYQGLVLSDQRLLGLAIETAHKAGKPDLEAMYRAHIQNHGYTGEKNEHDTTNG